MQTDILLFKKRIMEDKTLSKILKVPEQSVCFAYYNCLKAISYSGIKEGRVKFFLDELSQQIEAAIVRGKSVFIVKKGDNLNLLALLQLSKLKCKYPHIKYVIIDIASESPNILEWGGGKYGPLFQTAIQNADYSICLFDHFTAGNRIKYYQLIADISNEIICCLCENHLQKNLLTKEMLRLGRKIYNFRDKLDIYLKMYPKEGRIESKESA